MSYFLFFDIAEQGILLPWEYHDGRREESAMLSVRETGNWTVRYADRRIFGNFIELGFGRQIDGLWSEMLFNRAFRHVPEYTYKTWEWLGLDQEHYNDKAPFWHSGYEQFDWEAVGSPRVSHSLGTYTYKGTTSLLLENTQEGSECGIRQQGVHLKAGRKYRFRLFAGYQGRLSQAGLNGFGTAIQSAEEKRMEIRLGRNRKEIALTTIPRLYEWSFTAEADEIAEISLVFSFQGTLILAFSSLMPTDALSGWRKDAVELLRQTDPSVVRYPGGCFTSFYHWESSIGDRDRREPQESYYWGGIEENDCGLDEFMELAHLVGFEPQICFNMMTSEPFKAKQMVEYLNAPADVGMGEYRALNGHPEPYHVRLFEMDNEPDRKWSAEQYAEQCVLFARKMREAYPEIEFMMAAYCFDPGLLRRMLEIAGQDVQYVIYRQGDPDFVRKILPILREYNQTHGTDVRLVDTEWLPPMSTPEPYEDPEMAMEFSWYGQIRNDVKNNFSSRQVGWNYALNGAHRLLDYISYGGEFALANFNNMCNTWGQNVVECTKDSAFLSCMGQVFRFFGKKFEPCVAELCETGDRNVFAVRTRTQSGKNQLYVVNHLSRPVSLTLPEGDWNAAEGLSAPHRISQEKEHQREVREIAVPCEDGIAELPGLSVVCFSEG